MALFSSMKVMVDRYYKGVAARNCNTCHVGAWFVCRESHLMEKSGGASMKALFNRIASRKQEAVIECSAAAETASCEREECKILIVCKGHSFSRSVADYAVSMAQKTRSSLVALNVDEAGRDFESFQAEAKSNIEYFSCKAADAGLGFSHAIRQGDQDSIISQLHEADSRFRYVIDDTAAVCRSRGVIPVYTRATLRAK